MAKDEIYEACKIDHWFIDRLEEIVALEMRVKQHGLPDDADNFRLSKSHGFSDVQLASLSGKTEAEVRALCIALGRRLAEVALKLARPA